MIDPRMRKILEDRSRYLSQVDPANIARIRESLFDVSDMTSQAQNLRKMCESLPLSLDDVLEERGRLSSMSADMDSARIAELFKAGRKMDPYLQNPAFDILKAKENLDWHRRAMGDLLKTSSVAASMPLAQNIGDLLADKDRAVGIMMQLPVAWPSGLIEELRSELSGDAVADAFHELGHFEDYSQYVQDLDESIAADGEIEWPASWSEEVLARLDRVQLVRLALTASWICRGAMLVVLLSGSDPGSIQFTEFWEYRIEAAYFISETLRAEIARRGWDKSE